MQIKKSNMYVYDTDKFAKIRAFENTECVFAIDSSSRGRCYEMDPCTEMREKERERDRDSSVAKLPSPPTLNSTKHTALVLLLLLFELQATLSPCAQYTLPAIFLTTSIQCSLVPLFLFLIPLALPLLLLQIYKISYILSGGSKSSVYMLRKTKTREKTEGGKAGQKEFWSFS